MTIPQTVAHCIDLHCHSTASDGALAPAELVARAHERGVTHLALTDHDTLNGLAEARSAARNLGMTLIAGIELSCVWQRQTIHVVGLDFDPVQPAFLAAVKAQEESRWLRADAIAQRLSALNVEDLLARATAQAEGDVPGRPHFARVLVEAGIVKDMAQAFQRHLGAGKRGDVKAFWPDLETVVQWITAAGGIAVVAHPRKYKLTATKLRALVTDFQAAGGEAIEVSTSGQSSGDLGFLAELCRRQKLLASQGSDFHFPSGWSELGRMMALPEGLEPVWERFREPVVA